MTSTGDLKQSRSPSSPLPAVKVNGVPAVRNGPRPSPEEQAALRSALAVNLARLRVGRGWSLRELASRADVSKALLSRIERGDGNPSLHTLFRICAALGCSISELVAFDTFESQVIRAGDGRAIQSEDGRVVSRLIFAGGEHSRIEIYDCEMAPQTRSEWEGRPGYEVTEYAIVGEGSVRIGTQGKEEVLGPSDAMVFKHDAINVYESLDGPARVLCVVAYNE
jgi:transcriptional regulator with XRE-family HTH domain